ncbi:meiotic nuclear division protein 1 [Heterostelium album PN500]|uniref:Meiotic nuclear division protein 1 n=1 Tax=Heterostelium pallidum (strain ATCC 26659 / Pp 5 / PN500) TaxID=670386 RepID=D3BF45_HETP5|nr:meiotic nuclear division protein 1 [Heterostelium album PN500]EFA79759.1 meiotic nuclear division protein 1 [Heterostelium album PN500]|eukprot:XP_020431880.1 meiotic nuclear division protein 1 [Heterostelium album PN500]
MSTRKKGLSDEEKKEKLKKFFYDSSNVYSSKDVESEASEATGIPMIAVRETIKLMVADGIVQTDKLGASTFYWAFPSFERNQAKNKNDELTKAIADIKERIASETKKNETLKQERIESDERTNNLERIKELEAQSVKLNEELAGYADVETMEEMKKELKIAVEAVNRNTDNIDALRSFCDKKWGVAKEDFYKNFQIDPNMEYLEY